MRFCRTYQWLLSLPLIRPSPPTPLPHAPPLCFCQLKYYPGFLALIKCHLSLKRILITPNNSKQKNNQNAVRIIEGKETCLKEEKNYQ